LAKGKFPKGTTVAKYIKRYATEKNIYKDIKLNTKVIGLE